MFKYVAKNTYIKYIVTSSSNNPG